MILRITIPLAFICSAISALTTNNVGISHKIASLEKIPQGVAPTQYTSYTLNTTSFNYGDVHLEGGRHHQNSFKVTPNHVLLPNNGGVQFNTETVPDALADHRNKIRISREEELNMISSSRIEATSKHEPNLFYQGGNGFMVAAITAFAQHLPLELSPDHVWSLITYAFAKHVEENAEELRKNFVTSKGKKHINIRTPNSFKISRKGNPDSGASATEWEAHVFSQFSAEIKKNIGEETHSALTADFSTTDASSRAASEIVLMAAMKEYFKFYMVTFCGIPEITLLGSDEDWVALRQRSEALGELMLPKYKKYWMPALLPVLDKFVESYRGQVDHGFWQSMVKLRHNGHDSGSSEFISGWIQIFFPYLGGSDTTTAMRQWNEMYFSGPEMDEFPPIASFAPVDWHFFGRKFKLEFHAGITGARQDPETGCVSPVTGWYVTHKSVRSRLKKRWNDLKVKFEEWLEEY